MFGLKDKHYGIASCALRSLGRLCLGVLVARRLGTDGYSLFVILIGTEVIVSTFSNALYAQPLLTMAPGLSHDERVALEGHARRRVASFAGVVLVIGMVVAPLVGAVAQVSAWTLLLFISATAAMVVADCSRAIRQGRFESQRTVVADLMAYGVPVTCLLMLGSDLVGMQTLMWGLVFVGQLLAIRIMRIRRVSVRPEQETLRRYRELAVPFATGSAVVSLSSRTQPYVLGALASTAQLSWFGCALSLMGPMRLLSGSLSSVLRPRLALQQGHGDHVAQARCLRQALVLQLALGATLFVTTVLGGSWLARLVFGDAFEGVGALLPVAVIFAMLEGIGAIQTVAAQTRSTNGARLATRARTLAGSVGLILLACLCPLAGASGALWALVAAETVFLWRLLLPAGQVMNRVRSIP
jgi:O-antigen/teichoic acid export membrane protein